MISNQPLYGVRYSAHGARCIPNKPVCDKTLQEAARKAHDWAFEAQFYGGFSEIVDENGEVIAEI